MFTCGIEILNPRFVSDSQYDSTPQITTSISQGNPGFGFSTPAEIITLSTNKAYTKSKISFFSGLCQEKLQSDAHVSRIVIMFVIVIRKSNPMAVILHPAK